MPLQLSASKSERLHLTTSRAVARWWRFVLLPLAPLASVMLYAATRGHEGAMVWLRVSELEVDSERVRVQFSCGPWRATRRLAIDVTSIEDVKLRIGTADRLLPLRLRLRCRDGDVWRWITLDFEIENCDRREEALDFFFRLARALGASRYRVCHAGDKALAVELLLTKGKQGSYRTAVNAPDTQAVPRARDELPIVSWQPKFRAPAGDHAPFNGSVSPYRAVSPDPGVRVVIRHPVDWPHVLVMLFFFLPVGVPMIAVCSWAMAGLLGLLVFGLLSTPFMLFFDVWPVLDVVWSLGNVVGILLSAVLTLLTTWLPLYSDKHKWGQTSDLDWRAETATLSTGPFRKRIPLSTICGVAVHGDDETLRVYLQLPDSEHLMIEHANPSLRGLAVELARALDVPVRLPGAMTAPN
jgi:hypothetical protein